MGEDGRSNLRLDMMLTRGRSVAQVRAQNPGANLGHPR